MDELRWLRSAGILTLYVRAASFTSDGQNIKTMIPQRWKNNAGGMPVVLTFNFDGGLRSHFGDLPNEPMAKQIVDGIAHARSDAETHGIRVAGVQLDVDCPTRLLPKYAELLRAIRPALKLRVNETFSVTGLQTWLTSGDYKSVADACDFVAPQFYEGSLPKSVGAPEPIANVQGLERGLDRAGSVGKPFQAGLAVYGHALLYDQRGELSAMYHGMQPEDALRHPALRFESTQPITERGQSTGENVMVMKAIRPDRNGQGLGCRIAYTLPTPQMLTRQLDIVRRHRPPNCTGIILYRFPEPADELNLPLASISQCLAGNSCKAAFKAKIERHAVPWGLIGEGRPAKQAPMDYSVEVKSIGTAATIAGPGALTVLLAFDGRGLGEVEPGDFDDIRTGTMNDRSEFEPCAATHANAVLLRRYQVLPGASLRTGLISVDADGPVPIRLRWAATGCEGSAVSGETVLPFGPADVSKEHHP